MDQEDRINGFLQWAIADGPPSSEWTLTREDAVRMLVIVADQAAWNLYEQTVERVQARQMLDGI